jgi:hypothetical protein
MNHIALFNQACAIVFAKLYESFPIPLEFDQREMGFYDRADISEEATLRRKVFHETLCFLKEEGFIVFDFNAQGNVQVHDARLTSKGLSKLQRVPAGIQDDSKPLGELLSDALSSVGDKAAAASLAETVKRVLSLVFGQ